MSSESTSRWVEGVYKRNDFTTFKARFHLPIGELCPPTTLDKNGVSGSIVEGSCIEINQGCFIASAAFGSELHPRVQTLRNFRDEILLKSELADDFKRVLFVYYKFSPTIARAMNESKLLKLFLKYILVYPVVLFSGSFATFLRITHENWKHKATTQEIKGSAYL